jgi:hypothetical protein
MVPEPVVKAAFLIYCTPVDACALVGEPKFAIELLSALRRFLDGTVEPTPLARH